MGSKADHFLAVNVLRLSVCRREVVVDHLSNLGLRAIENLLAVDHSWWVLQSIARVWTVKDLNSIEQPVEHCSLVAIVRIVEDLG